MLSWRLLGASINIGAILICGILGASIFDEMNQHMIWCIVYYYYALYYIAGCLFYFLNDLTQMKIYRVLSLFGFILLVLPIIAQLNSGMEDIHQKESEYEKIDGSEINEHNDDYQNERKQQKEELNLIYVAIVFGMNSIMSILNILITFYCSKNLLNEQQKLTKDISSAFQAFETEIKQSDVSLKHEQVKIDSSKVEINSFVSI